jgi:glucosamine kinase
MSFDDNSQLVLAIDGGGSKTACAVARYDESTGWQVLGRGHGGPSNPSAVGIDTAREAILQATHAAHAEVGSPLGTAQRAVIALAGTLRDDMREEMQSVVDSLGLAAAVRVVPDLLPILYAASPTGTGVGLISGTGSVGFARNHQGQLKVVGGWGYLLGDEGSGYWLGREALRGLLARMTLGEPLNPLDEKLLEQSSATSIDDLKRYVYTSSDPRQQIARLARLVVQQAEGTAASPVAISLLDRCSQSLAQLARDAARHLGDSTDYFTIAAAGGLLTGSPTLLSQLEVHLQRLGLRQKIVNVSDPLAGCFALSRDPAFTQPLVVV